MDSDLIFKKIGNAFSSLKKGTGESSLSASDCTLGNMYRVKTGQRSGQTALRFDVLIGTYRSARLLRRCCIQKTKRKTAASSLICEGRIQ